ncbi:MAG: hypothetical protein VKS61_15755 [Candidatus Sericytochromatia bacterium]|nr:hypothetical protein [Candidatus Sericytochromatia bacterium]
MRTSRLFWAACTAAVTASWGATAQAEEGPSQAEKLPVQLPTVTVQGDDRSRPDAGGTARLTPSNDVRDSRVRLPDPAQRRATAEEAKGLMVSVTPSTVEAPAPLPSPRMPFTSITGGWGPPLQYRAGLYDARWLGPVLALSELESQSGMGWVGLRGREWLDWPGLGRVGGLGETFGWEVDSLRGGQSAWAIALDLGQSSTWTGTLRHDRGAASVTGGAELLVARTGAHTEWRPTGFASDHQPLVALTAQHRVWGRQAGAEAYLRLADRWTLTDSLAMEWGLGGGHWGREPILDPSFTFHYRPSVLTHLFAGLKAASELPDFDGLYLRRPATAPNDDLNAERVEGWAELGGSHRLSERLWVRVTGDVRRSWRHIFWADPERDGLWVPLNAAGEQWSPRVDAQVQLEWKPRLQQTLRYRGRTTLPLGTTEHRVSTGLEASLPGPGGSPIAATASLAWQQATLSALQLPGGGAATGLFAEADFRFPLTADLALGLRAADLPLLLQQPSARNYFAPAPLLTAYAQYQF